MGGRILMLMVRVTLRTTGGDSTDPTPNHSFLISFKGNQEHPGPPSGHSGLVLKNYAEFFKDNKGVVQPSELCIKCSSSNMIENEVPTPKLWGRRNRVSTIPFLPLTAIFLGKKVWPALPGLQRKVCLPNVCMG